MYDTYKLLSFSSMEIEGMLDYIVRFDFHFVQIILLLLASDFYTYIFKLYFYLCFYYGKVTQMSEYVVKVTK